MMKFSHDSNISKGVIVRTFTADTAKEAAMLTHEHGGTSERIHNGTKHVWRVRTIKKQS